MATYEIKLPPVNNRRNRQTTQISRVINGDDVLKIYAGWNLEIPNHWEMTMMNIMVDCDATVANRYVHYIQYINGLPLSDFSSTAITASQSKGHYLGRYFIESNMSPEGIDRRLSFERDFSLLAGDDYIEINMFAGVAGDSMTIRANFIWRNNELGLLMPEQFEEGEYPK